MALQNEDVLKILYAYQEYNYDLWFNVIGASVKNIKYGPGEISDVEINKFGVFLTIHFLDFGDKKFNVNAFKERFLSNLKISDDAVNAILVDVKKLKEEITEKTNRERGEELNRIETALNRNNIKSLYYIVHIDGLYSIISKGLFCRDLIESEGIVTHDISDELVQARRRRYHQYVNLYFADNTPMLYVVCREHSDRIILLELDPLIAIKGKILFTDGNAASDYKKIYNDLNDLDRLDWSIIKARKGAYTIDDKRIRSAELLIEKHVESECIRCIHVQSIRCKNVAQGILGKLGRDDIQVKKDLTLKGIN